MSLPIKTVDDKEIYRIKGEDGHKIVLAYRPIKDEWVTWGTDDEIENFYWGHYFETREAAEKDFELR